MDQFIVPQFIDVENKIIGPISTRQFIILLVAGMIMFLCYKLMTFWAFAITALLILGLSVVIAFVKINGQMFHIFLLNIIQTLKRPNLRIWNKNDGDEKAKEEIKVGMKILAPKKLVSSSHLTELSLKADLGGIYNFEDEEIGEMADKINNQKNSANKADKPMA